ncbi:unnamed protein product [Pieris brassicae]|uniref:Glucuronosyltransferase n=1 Tax=Pieris brassicae TaxID=7116 RepID=A0A9P0TEL8_PIEBR|nr:unnamed protein product [Pieris brassicae]
MYKIVTLLVLFCVCDGFKILLFFPVPGKSHSILGEGYVRYLSNAGHEVTYVTPIIMKNPPPRVRQVDISQNIGLLPGHIFDIKQLMYKELDLQEMYIIRSVIRNFINGTIQGSTMQHFMHDPKEQYDVVVVEWLYTELGSGLSAVFNCPLIWSTSTEVHSEILSLIGDGLNPAYSVYIWDREFSTTFYYRLRHLWLLFKDIYDRVTYKAIENKMFEQSFLSAVESRGRRLPTFDEVRYNASLMLGNSHISTGDPHSLPQAYKSIGGYHIKENVESLPKDLQKVMDSAKHGVVYFSLGTMLRSSALPEGKTRELLDAFGTLKQTVIWKYEDPLTNVPKNVHVIQWAPQPSILAHPNTVLFITHGGILSLYEILSIGIPLIGIPMFGDQFTNVNRAVKNGYAKRFDIGEQPVKKLLQDIKEITDNPKYGARAKEMSRIYHSRTAAPGVELVHWIEEVVTSQGAPYLRSPALGIPLYQKYYLDFFAAIIVVFTIIGYLMRILLSNISKKSLDIKKTN